MTHPLALLFRIRGFIKYFSFFYLNPRGLNIIRDSFMVPIVFLSKNSFNLSTFVDQLMN